MTVEEVDPREYLLESTAWDDNRIDRLKHLKRQFAEVFDVDLALLDAFEPRTERVLDLNSEPTRRQKLGYKWQPTVEDRKAKLPLWAKNVVCPICSGIMTPLKSKQSRDFGETITYQCHNVNAVKIACLAMVQVTTTCNHWMRPGDFTSSDFDWSEVAKETLAITQNTRVVAETEIDSTEKPTKMPPCPWTKNVQGRVIWVKFWEMYFEFGEVDIDDLMERVKVARPGDRRGPKKLRLEQEMEWLPGWMQRRTGYVVKQFGKVFRVVGKSPGRYDKYPFSTEEYRIKFGFEKALED